MKISLYLYLLLGLAFLAVPSLAQEKRIAFINTAAFAHPTTGITQLVNAINSVDQEFEPRRRELTEAHNRLLQLAEELRGVGPIPTDPRPMTRERRKEVEEQIESMRRAFERSRRQMEIAHNRRLKEVTEPIHEEIRGHLRRFAVERGIEMVIEASGLQCLVGCEVKDKEGVDVTREFIAAYNGVKQ